MVVTDTWSGWLPVDSSDVEVSTQEDLTGFTDTCYVTAADMMMVMKVDGRILPL